MSKNKTIIIAEDDPGMQEAMELIFTRAGYDTTIVANGEPLLANNFNNPDVFVLDKQLSGIDGLDICKFLKHQESTRHIPVIMLSANPQIGILSQAAGADGFLEKPFRLKSLLEMVKKYAFS